MEMEGGTTFHFIDASPAEALEVAKEAAGDQDVRLGGGATTIRDFLTARLVDHMHVVVAPILLGRGVRLWDGLESHVHPRAWLTPMTARGSTAAIGVGVQDAHLGDLVDRKVVRGGRCADRVGRRGVVDAEDGPLVVADVGVHPGDPELGVATDDTLGVDGERAAVGEHARDDVPGHAVQHPPGGSGAHRENPLGEAAHLG
jgi:hypothetical protein